jgi:hypothetical protein
VPDEVAGDGPVAGDETLDQVEAGDELADRRGSMRPEIGSTGHRTPKTRMNSSPHRKSGMASTCRDNAVDAPLGRRACDSRRRAIARPAPRATATSEAISTSSSVAGRRFRDQRQHVLPAADRGAEIADGDSLQPDDELVEDRQIEAVEGAQAIDVGLARARRDHHRDRIARARRAAARRRRRRRRTESGGRGAAGVEPRPSPFPVPRARWRYLRTASPSGQQHTACLRHQREARAGQ